LNKYWKDLPEQIYLISETEDFEIESVKIKVFKFGRGHDWGDLLYSALSMIDTKYVFFSLEDFFVCREVDEESLEKCMEIMDADDGIAEIRLKPSSDKTLVEETRFGVFRKATEDTPYRVDTQFALWRREVLLELVRKNETAWEFEKNATKRAKDTEYTFLWNYSKIPNSIENMIIPYHLDAKEHFKEGYSIAWGKWLWNNKQLFEQNGIFNVNYKELGVLSQKSAERRRKWLYRFDRDDASFAEMIVQFIYKLLVGADRYLREIRINGTYGLDNVVLKIRNRIHRVSCGLR
jgi:hypothetical protein